MRKMFTIFQEEDAEWTEDAKIRFLFKKIQNSGLAAEVAALKAKRNSDTDLSFTSIANQLAAAVSDLPETVSMKSRSVSFLNSSDTKKSPITKRDGSIFTGYYPNWGKLTREDQKKVLDERKRLGIKKGGSASKEGRIDIKKLSKQLNKVSRQVSALKKKRKEPEGSDDNQGSVTDDAGNMFGGKASKVTKKKKD